jgi:hypothetical protein
MSATVDRYDIDGITFNQQLGFVTQRMGHSTGEDLQHRTAIFETVNQIDQKHKKQFYLKTTLVCLSAALTIGGAAALLTADKKNRNYMIPAGLLTVGVGIYCAVRRSEVSDDKRKTETAMFTLAAHADWNFNQPKEIARVARELVF